MVVQEKPECCKRHVLPYEGFVVDICQEYKKLVDRHLELQPTRRRIKFLALPKYMTSRFMQPCPCDSTRKTEIVRDLPCQTRTEQLAYPYLRKLLFLKNEFESVLGEERVNVLNRTIRKSVLSLYSRLANVQAPKKLCIIPGWTKKDWAVHKRYLRKLAKPKRRFRREKGIHIWKELSLMRRFIKLAQPKQRLELEGPKWELTDAMRKYRASERILLLSKPKERDEYIHFQPLPLKVSPDAMHYKASERIKQLATPPEVRLGESDVKENPFGIAPNALKGKASSRVQELAQPKEYTDNHTRENPFAISPAALKAKASPRVLELAKPKGS